MANIGPMELLALLALALLLFGGTRLARNLAGIGKGVGRSIREFKEEVKSTDQDKDGNKPEVVEAEIVDDRAAELERRQRALEAREQALKEAELEAREAALNSRQAETGH